VQADSDVAWRRCHPDQHVRGDRDPRFRLDAALSAWFAQPRRRKDQIEDCVSGRDGDADSGTRFGGDTDSRACGHADVCLERRLKGNTWPPRRRQE
jgi:hypothetical protein